MHNTTQNVSSKYLVVKKLNLRGANEIQVPQCLFFHYSSPLEMHRCEVLKDRIYMCLSNGNT